MAVFTCVRQSDRTNYARRNAYGARTHADYELLQQSSLGDYHCERTGILLWKDNHDGAAHFSLPRNESESVGQPDTWFYPKLYDWNYCGAVRNTRAQHYDGKEPRSFENQTHV